jgi:hypothetical protein
MITNSELTVYHKGFDEFSRSEIWTRYNYEKIWWFGGKGASTNKGYDNANDVQVRIPYKQNDNLDVSNFEIGDILVKGRVEKDITRQQDLKDYLVYNITSINNDDFGSEPHIHLSGK